MHRFSTCQQHRLTSTKLKNIIGNIGIQLHKYRRIIGDETPKSNHRSSRLGVGAGLIIRTIKNNDYRNIVTNQNRDRVQPILEVQEEPVSKVPEGERRQAPFMKHRSETRKGAPRSMILSSKLVTSIGAWNVVRSMFEGGAALVIASEMQRYKLSIVGVSETHWTQSGETRLQSRETVIFLGHQGESAAHSKSVDLPDAG